MTALFNTIGHETEGATSAAASRVFMGIAAISRMLSSVEMKDETGANLVRGEAAGILRSTVPEFERLAVDASDQTLFTTTPSDQIYSAELSELEQFLREHGLSVGMRNRDIFRISAREVRALIDVLEHISFVGKHVDWYASREVIEQVNRLMTVGVVMSRIASLHGDDPGLRN
jgi:hypothetical protein